MEWKKYYLDLILVPLSLLASLLYHCWLWRALRLQPDRTYTGITNIGQRAWFEAMLKDNDKKSILVVQTLRNNIMGSTLMATTSILISCGVLTFVSKIYDPRRSVNPFAIEGDELKVDSKCVMLLVAYLAVFLCEALSVVCLIQVSIVINALSTESILIISKVHVLKALDKGIFLGNVGNRLFFTALPLLLWIFGPILVFVSSIGMVAVLYSIDVITCEDKKKGTDVDVQSRLDNTEAVELSVMI